MKKFAAYKNNLRQLSGGLQEGLGENDSIYQCKDLNQNPAKPLPVDFAKPATLTKPMLLSAVPADLAPSNGILPEGSVSQKEDPAVPSHSYGVRGHDRYIANSIPHTTAACAGNRDERRIRARNAARNGGTDQHGLYPRSIGTGEDGVPPGLLNNFKPATPTPNCTATTDRWKQWWRLSESAEISGWETSRIRVYMLVAVIVC